MLLFLEYPKCSTCQKARRWLEGQGVTFTSRHIVEASPTVPELDSWSRRSALPLQCFFNTRGLVYKSLHLKAQLPHMSREEQLALLATNGMLVKRPLLVGDDFVLVGFTQAQWQQAVK